MCVLGSFVGVHLDRLVIGWHCAFTYLPGDGKFYQYNTFGIDAMNPIRSLIICVKLLLCQCQKLRVNFMSESDDWTLST